MLEIKTKWVYPKASKTNSAIIKKLAMETGLTETLCTLFYNRNIRTKEEIKFSFPSDKTI